MKSICFVDYDMSVRGGVEQVTASLANALSDTCHVHVVSLVQRGQLQYDLDGRITCHSFLTQEQRLRQMQKTLAFRLAAYFRENHIDVAFLQGYYPGFIAAPARLKCKTRLVFCDHGALMNQWEQKDTVLSRWVAAMLCHRTVTLTNQSKADYKKKFHLSEKKLRCIYNWIDLDVEHAEEYDSTSKRIISAGRFGKEKGFDMLVRAFSIVAQQHPDWKLDIYGDGEMMPVVRSLIAESGLQEKVNLMGMCSDIASRYRSYAMYVLPSHREGMPLVLLEAKANRLPIVSFDVQTGPREIVRDEVDGLLVQPEDIQGLAQAICRLIDDTALRVEMSRRSQENLELFSKTAILNQWRRLIEE